MKRILSLTEMTEQQQDTVANTVQALEVVCARAIKARPRELRRQTRDEIVAYLDELDV